MQESSIQKFKFRSIYPLLFSTNSNNQYPCLFLTLTYQVLADKQTCFENQKQITKKII